MKTFILIITLNIIFFNYLFTQKKNYWLEEFRFGINSSFNSNFDNKLGFNLTILGKPINKTNFSVLLGVEYLNSSTIVKDIALTKYSEIKNGIYRFNFISVPLIFRHDFFHKKLFFEYSLKFDYDVASSHEFLNKRNKLNLFVLPSIQFGLGNKISFGEENVLILLGTNLSTKLMSSITKDYVLRYNTIYFSVAYAL